MTSFADVLQYDREIAGPRAACLFATSVSDPLFCTQLAQPSSSPGLNSQLEPCASTVCLWENSPGQMPPPRGSFPCLPHFLLWVEPLDLVTFCSWLSPHCNLYYSMDNGCTAHPPPPGCELPAASRLVPSCCCACPA